MFKNLLEKFNELLMQLKNIFVRLYSSITRQKMLDIYNIYKYKIKNLAETNFNLGVHHFSRGYLNDAIFRFKLLKRFCSRYPQCDYYIARCYIEKLQYQKAKPFIDAYISSGDSIFASEALYCKNLVNGKVKKIEQVPDTIVSHLFDKQAYAYAYDNKLIATDLSDMLFEVLDTHIKHSSKPFGNNILYIGNKLCNLAKLCRESKIGDVINAVEVSNVMLEVSRNITSQNLNVYTHISFFDSFQDYFDSIANAKKCAKYDIIILNDVIAYFTNIDLIFSNIKKLTLKNSVVLLSFENNTKADKFISQTERFVYSPLYIKEQLAQYGLQVLLEARRDISANQSMIAVLLKFTQKSTSDSDK